MSDQRTALAGCNDMNWFRRNGIIVAAAALHASAEIVWAQKDSGPADHEEGWLKWAVAGGLAVVICITGFINAKRTHLS